MKKKKKKKTNIHPCFHLKHPTPVPVIYAENHEIIHDFPFGQQDVMKPMVFAQPWVRATPVPAHGYPVNPMSGRTYGVRDIPHRARRFIGEKIVRPVGIVKISCQFVGYFLPIHWVAYTISSSRINPEFVNWLGTWWVPFVAEFSNTKWTDQCILEYVYLFLIIYYICFLL